MSTIRIACVPNITFAKDLEKDSYCQYLNVIIRQLNTLRKDLHFYLLLPQPVSYLSELPNVTTLKYWVPTHAPTMRVNFSATRIKTLFGKNLAIDLVWSHQPEITHALSVALETQTHHRPRIFGYAHWFDFDVVAKWPGSFRENISGLLEMDRCFINTKAQRALVYTESRKWFSQAVITKLTKIIRIQPPPILQSDVASSIDRSTDKVIVWNHRPGGEKDWDRFLRVVRALRKRRRDFTVWAPLLDKTPPEPWMSNERHSDKKSYYAHLRRCRVGVSLPQSYGGWSISTTDGLMNGCPYVMWDTPYYKELWADADIVDSDASLAAALNKYLDDVPYRNTKARAARRHAERKLASLRSAEQLSRFIDFEVTRLGTTVTDRTRELVALVRKHGKLTKMELMKAGRWGGFPWSRHRRGLLSHPRIEDMRGDVPTYRWLSRAKRKKRS